MRNFFDYSSIIVDNHKLDLAPPSAFNIKEGKWNIDFTYLNKFDFLNNKKNYFGLDITPYDHKVSLTKHKNQISYNGMPKTQGYYVVIHEYSNTQVGHVNLELIHNGVRIAWLGANQNGINKLEPGLKGKIFDEADDSITRIRNFSKDHSITARQVSEKEFNIMLNRANHLFTTKTDYDITDNCLHFVDDVLSYGYEKYGKGNETLSHYVKANTLANFYASLTSMGLKLNDANLKEEAYKAFIQQHREKLSEHHSFLDLKLEEVRHSLHSGKIEKRLTITASNLLKIHSDGDHFDIHKLGDLNGRNIYLHETTEDNTYKITFGQNENDIIYDGGGNDKLILYTENYHKLWFNQENNHLKITDLESNGSVTILDWFKTRWRGGFKRGHENILTHRIEKISINSGKSIASEQVDKLVQAMSSFSPPKNGQINVSAEQQADLNKIIATNWE